MKDSNNTNSYIKENFQIFNLWTLIAQYARHDLINQAHS